MKNECYFLGLYRSAFVGICVFGLMACTNIQIQKNGSFDQTAKTISVPKGSRGLNGEIKSGLNRAGWRMVVSNGETLTEGVLGNKVSLTTFDNPNKTRYGLSMRWEQDAYRLVDQQKMYVFDISVVDKKDGNEILTMSGRDGGRTITKRFIEAISN